MHLILLHIAFPANKYFQNSNPEYVRQRRPTTPSRARNRFNGSDLIQMVEEASPVSTGNRTLPDSWPVKFLYDQSWDYDVQQNALMAELWFSGMFNGMLLVCH